MQLRRLASALVIALAIMTVVVQHALASTGPALRSTEQAGYSVTGAHFELVESWMKLPEASRFAREIGRLSVSAQLWTKRLVFDLRFTACTDASCRPGGRPETHRYRMEFTVYKRNTGALVCSTSAPRASRCPGTGRNWAHQRCRPGRNAQFALVADPRVVNLNIGGSGCDAALAYYPVALHANFWQARLGVEFGVTPWAHVPFRRPGRRIALVSFDRPTPPPNSAEIATLSGSTGGIAGWWTHHEVKMTRNGASGSAEARPGKLWDQGYGFTVFLVP